MVSIRNPITNEVMSVRGEKTFWVFDEEIGKKRKYLIADYLVDKKRVVETPKAETPKIETPKIETPKIETPATEPIIVEKPRATQSQSASDKQSKSPEVVEAKPQKRVKRAQIEEKTVVEPEVTNFGFF